MLINNTIRVYPRKNTTISLHPNVVRELRLENQEDAILCFGIKQINVNVVVRKDQELNTILLSQDCIEYLSLPLTSNFNISKSNNQISIGPFSGILAAKSNRQLVNKLKKLLVYCEQYNVYGGMVIAFSLEGINRKNQTIEGYVYNPKKSEWEKGTFPYPSAIYLRIQIKKRLLKHFYDHIGNTIFNSDHFTKWEMYSWLKKTEIHPHLPKTVLYKSAMDIIKFLRFRSSVIIKPISGLKGRKVKEIRKISRHYIVCFRENGKNKSLYFNEATFIKYITQTIKSRKYIIQEKLNLVFKEKRVVDFRLFLTKNHNGDWECLGWVGRRGVPKSVVSNRSSGGVIEPGDKTLQSIIDIPNEELSELRKEIFSLAIKAAKNVEKEDMNFGFFAVDIAVDRQGEIWLLEMNHRNPNDKLPLYISDQETYRNIKVSRMKYLKFLAGF